MPCPFACFHNMKRFYLTIGGIPIEARCRYDLIREKCADYITDTAPADALVMEATDRDLQIARDWFRNVEGREISDAEAEFDRAPYTLYPHLPSRNAFWLHACAVEMDGAAYAISAPSGYGKTTQTKLWRQVYGDALHVINGDNPIIVERGGDFLVCGTPFCGKEGWHLPTAAPLRGVCFLLHSNANHLRRLDPAQAVMRLLRDNPYAAGKALEPHLTLYERFAARVPMYALYCNTEPEAAIVAYEGMKKGAMES